VKQTLSIQQHQLPHEIRQLQIIQADERLLPLPVVESKTGFKSSFIYQLIKDGKFPKPVKIGNASRWRQSEVQAWIAEQIQNSVSVWCYRLLFFLR
jgi:predicted DNA-binding transcriptional regulator AlpA